MLDRNGLKDFVDSSMKKGFTGSQLRDALKSSGYKKAEIDAVLPDSSQPKAAQPSSPVSSVQPKHHAEFFTRKNMGFSLLFLAMIIMIVFILALILNNSYTGILQKSPSIGSTQDMLQQEKQSFIDTANQCKEASIVIDVAGSKLGIIAKDCVLTKSFMSFADSEPQDIITLFKGKSMQCSYASITADDLSLTTNIQNCDGALKDSIYRLKISQYLK